MLLLQIESRFHTNKNKFSTTVNHEMFLAVPKTKGLNAGGPLTCLEGNGNITQ